MSREIGIGREIPFDANANPPEAESGMKPGSRRDAKDEIGKDKKPGSRIPLIALVIIAVFAVSSSIALYVLKEKEVNKRLTVEENLEAVELAKVKVERELKDTLEEKDQLAINLTQQKENYKMVLIELNEQEEANKKLLDKYGEKMRLISSIKSKLDKEESEKNKLSRSLEKERREHESIKLQLSQIRMAKEALENRIIILSRKKKFSTVELEKIVVDEAPGTPDKTNVLAASEEPRQLVLIPTGGLEGQVLVVNKEFAFVVINLGQKDGLKEAEVLDVFRGQEPLGRVQVERIYDTMSSAVILPDFKVKEIKEGDIVKLI